MKIFKRLRRLAIQGILDISRTASLSLFHHQEASFNDMLFIEFRFGLNQDVRDHLRTAQAVADIAELMTTATRNDWPFRPQLICDGKHDVCYRVPVPAKHAAIIKQFTTPNPHHWS